MHALGRMHGGADRLSCRFGCGHGLDDPVLDPSDRITTIGIKIVFVAPVDTGKLTAQAKILHRGGETAVGDVAVLNQRGKLVAKVMAMYSIKNMI